MKSFKVDGKEYVVHYSINSLIRMEKATGKAFTEMFSGGAISMGMLRTIIYYGLISKHRNITEDDTGDLIDALIEDGGSITEISEGFIAELTKSLGIKAPKPEDIVDEDNSPN